MPDWLQAVILGLIEGITEFLPVSSTGHLLLAQHWLGKTQTDLFNVVIQCGTVCAVLAVFSGRMKTLLGSIHVPEHRNYFLKLACAFGVTAMGGLILKAADMDGLPEKPSPVAWAILVGGVAMLVIERLLRGKQLQAEVTWALAVAVGLAQLVAAIFPGTSRSGATILVALAFGLQRPIAIEFSFLVGVPTLLAAGALEFFSAYRHSLLGHENWFSVLLGSAVATVTAFVAVKWLLRYVQTHTFNAFGWYRLALGGLILLWLS